MPLYILAGVIIILGIFLIKGGSERGSGGKNSGDADPFAGTGWDEPRMLTEEDSENGSQTPEPQKVISLDDERRKRQ